MYPKQTRKTGKSILKVKYPCNRTLLCNSVLQVFCNKEEEKKTKQKTVGFICAPDGIFSMDVVRMILAGRRSSALWSSDEEPAGKKKRLVIAP